jgi:non-homologous end joining protein Ku
LGSPGPRRAVPLTWAVKDLHLPALDEKSKGQEIVIDTAPAPKRGQVIDIMEALKRSMERIPTKRKSTVAAPAKKKKKVS